MAEAVLEVDRIAKRYGDTVACQDVAFAIRPGEVLGLAGSAGAGKTTVLRVAVGELAADAGEVRLGGAMVTHATRRRIGYLPQHRGLYPRMRVLDQLVYFAELHGVDTNGAHRAAELWLARLGLREQRTWQGQQLRSGQRALLQLAAALVHGPEVLVLDEPFAGADPATVDMLAGVLAEHAEAGVPVLLTSDTLDPVERLCDRTGVLHNGRMVAVGTIGELRAGAAPQLLVDAPHAPPDWARSLAGVQVLSIHNGVTRLALAAGADDQAVLAAALATGPVREFTRVRPSLAEIFGDVVVAR